MRILLIEDERKLAQATKKALELQKYAVDIAFDGESALDFIFGEKDAYDLIISDIMLPGVDGISLCQQIRQEEINTPLLLLTAKSQIQDKVIGLDSGADDYLVKPFSFAELFARIRALIRRPKSRHKTILQAADLSLNPVTFKVNRGGKEIFLSKREFSLLEYLLRNKNKTLSKEDIVAHVWDFAADVLPSTVEVHIKHLRDKIDRGFSFSLITTVRGFGYQLKDER